VEEEKINITKPLKPKNSKVYDTISIEIIKYCVREIINHLTIYLIIHYNWVPTLKC
jgi:hypothetical protein